MLAARSQLLHVSKKLTGENATVPPSALQWGLWVLDEIATMPKMATYRATPLVERRLTCQRHFERFATDLERGWSSTRWRYLRTELDELTTPDLWPDYAPQVSMALWAATLDQMRAMQELSLEARPLRPSSQQDGEPTPDDQRVRTAVRRSTPSRIAHPDPYTELYESRSLIDDRAFAQLVLRASSSVLSGAPFAPFGCPVMAFRDQDRHLTRPLLDLPLASRRAEVPLAIWEATIELATTMYRGGITVLLDEWEREFEREKARMRANTRAHFDQAASSLQQAMWALTRRARMQVEPGKSPAAYWQHCSRYGPPMLWVLAQIVTAWAIEQTPDPGGSTWLRAALTITSDLEREAGDIDVEDAWRGAAAFLTDRFQIATVANPRAEGTVA